MYSKVTIIYLVASTAILFVIPLVTSNVDFEGVQAFEDVQQSLLKLIFPNDDSGRLYLTANKFDTKNIRFGASRENLIVTAIKLNEPTYFKKYLVTASRTVIREKTHYHLENIKEMKN